MSDSATPPAAQALSPRAGVAMLTLQLRNILQEAVAAETDVAALDVDAAVWQLRARLGPLIEDRRQALAEELRTEERRADAAVEAARADAAEIVRAAHEQAAEAEARREADEARRRTMLAAQAARAATAAEAEAATVAAEAEARREADESRRRMMLAAQAARATAVAVEAEPESAPTTALLDDSLVEEHPEIPTPADSFAPPESSTVPPPPAPLVLAMPEIVEATSAELLPPTADDLDPAQVDIHSAQVDLHPAQVDIEDDLDQSDLVAEDSTMWAEHPPVPASTIRLPVTAVESDGSLPAVAGQSQPMHVVIDAESFGRAFAAAMAPVLAALNQGPTQGQYPPPGWVPVQAPAPKKSFWAHAWHPDVLLSGLAMVIVIIVLIAWTG